jgi:hypothetical protein
MLISPLTPSVNVACSVLPSALLPLTILNGMLVDPDSLILPLRILQYISPTRYTYNILIKNEMEGKEIEGHGISNLVNGFIGIRSSFVVLVLMYLVDMAMAYCCMKRKVQRKA